jgi:hypothetical protein
MKMTYSLGALALAIALSGAAQAQQTPAAPAASPAAAAPAAAAKAPEYVAIPMSIDVKASAADTWKKVGKYCDLGTWMKIDCVVSSGTGEVGTVRKIAGGRVTEVLIAKSDLSYGYTQPAVEGKWYNLYHGYLEAKAVTAKTSKLNYTLMMDVSNLPDQAAKDKAVEGYKTRFNAALAEMKKIAEAK